MDIDVNDDPGNREDIKSDETCDEDVKVHDTSRFEDGDASLRCRACLSSGLKLFNIHQFKLGDAFFRITGTLVYKDRLPQHLCWYCRAVLLRGDAFRDRCLRSQEQLMAELQGELATNFTHTATRAVPTLSLSPVQIADYTDIKPLDEIKDEPDADIDIVDIETIINQAGLKTENSGDEATVSDRVENIVNVKEVDVKKRKRTAKKKIEIKDDSDEDSNGFDTENIEIEIGEDNDSTDIPTPVKKRASNHRKRKNGVKKIKKELGTGESKDLDVNTKPKEVKRRRNNKEVTRKFRKAENDYMPVFDFSKFENSYAVKIVTLSKEEQLREIELRKLSTNYVESPLKCVDCGKGFLAEAAFNNHRLRHDPSAGPYACEICNARFKMKCHRHAHQDTHLLKFFCQQCEFVSRNSARFKMKCCRQEHHDTQLLKFFCQECGFVSRTRSVSEPFVIAQPYACDMCSARFKVKCRRQEQQDSHLLKLCQECGFVSRTRHQARKHHAMHAGKIYACQHCGKCFDKSSTYLSHVRLAHPAMNEACDLCGETFVGKMGLRQHKAKTHSEIAQKPQFKCTTCSVNFASLDALNRHTDSGEHEGSPCEQCGESCASEDALKAHVGERHPSESHRCEECNATFTSAASYDLHHRRKHLNQPFSNAGRPPVRSYRTAPGQFVCEQCGRVMPTATCLRLHQRIHNAVKKYACPQCPKTFAAKHSLDWHIRSHTGEKPFQCPQCPLAFSINSNFKRHHKAVHLGQRARVPCSICARVFTTNSCLRVHVDMVHRGVPWPKRDRKRKKTNPKQ